MTVVVTIATAVEVTPTDTGMLFSYKSWLYVPHRCILSPSFDLSTQHSRPVFHLGLENMDCVRKRSGCETHPSIQTAADFPCPQHLLFKSMQRASTNLFAFSPAVAMGIPAVAEAVTAEAVTAVAAIAWPTLAPVSIARTGVCFFCFFFFFFLTRAVMTFHHFPRQMANMWASLSQTLNPFPSLKSRSTRNI